MRRRRYRVSDYAIVEANDNGKANTISLSAGIYTLTAAYTLTPGGYDDTGLPAVTGKLTIVGEGAEDTVIERSGSQSFRIFSVTGDLSLRRVTVRGGGGSSGGVPGIIRGGCILSGGTLAITDSVITNCQAREGAGLNVRSGNHPQQHHCGKYRDCGRRWGDGPHSGDHKHEHSVELGSVRCRRGLQLYRWHGDDRQFHVGEKRRLTGSAVHLGPASDAPRVSA